MLELFLKIQKIIRISILKRRLQNLYKKDYFKPEINPMIGSIFKIKQYLDYINWWYKSKYSNETLIFAKRKHLDEIIKSINSHKSQGKDGLKVVFYKHFSNKLAPVLLDVYDSRGKLGTIRIISAIYKKMIKEILKTIHPFHF